MRRLLIRFSFAAGTLMTLALAVAYTLHREESERLPKAIAEKAGLSSDAVRRFAREAKEEPSRPRTVYRFKRTIRATLSGKKLVDVVLSGSLFVDELPAKTEGARTERLSFVLDEGTTPAVSLKLTLDRDGRLLDLRQPPTAGLSETDAEAVSVLKDLASILAYASDEDTLGRYAARVRKEPNRFHKSKLRYETAAAEGIEILKSRHEVEWSDRAELPTRFTGEEETRAGLARQAIETFSAYAIVRAGAGREPAQARADTASAWEETRLAVQARGLVAPRVQWTEIRARWNESDSLIGQPRLAFYHRTLRSLKQHPEKIAELKDWILKSGARSATFGIGVLATHGTPEAQRTLREIYAELARLPEARGLQHTILSSFTTTEAKLEPETREFLAEVASDKEAEPELALNAAFAIGASIKKEPSEGDERKLLELTRGAADLEEKLAYIDAIGNSGSPNLLPALEDSLRSDNSRVRAKAVFALRWMRADAVTKRTEEFLTDASPDVRSAAERALRYQRGES